MPGIGTTLRLQPTRHAPSLARQAIRDCSADWPVEMVQAALTVVSELVTNAVLHGAGVVTVAVENRLGAVAIAVTDASPDGLRLLNHAVDADDGRGLSVVARLSSAWGVKPTTDGCGKTVWARLDSNAAVGWHELGTDGA